MIASAPSRQATFETPNELEIVVRRVVDAPRRLVFEAWTSPKYIPRWMLGPDGWTMPVCEVDLRVGGAWRFAWKKDDGAEMAMSGTYREVVPPKRLVSTERWGPEWPETVNAIDFDETDGRTTITITITYPSQAARDAALASGMTEGMRLTFQRFDKILMTLV
jgi:uncharacterized protein YndB with AHSA1/START domain